MQFIDQSAAYTRKSITLDKALASGRAKMATKPGAERLAMCFRPELKVAISFDLDIEDRLVFNDLSTPDKLDLLIDELLPRFFHPDILVLTGKSVWYARFIVDGNVERLLRMDDRGLHDATGQKVPADVEIETDIVTLLALLRAAIAEYHMRRPPYPELPVAEPDEDGEFEDADVSGS